MKVFFNISVLLFNGLLLFITHFAQAQIIISSGTPVASSRTVIASTVGVTNRSASADLSNIKLVMTNTSVQAFTNSSNVAVTLGEIVMNSTANVNIKGQWNISSNITLTNGIIVVGNLSTASNPDQLIYTGTKDLDEGSDASYIRGLFFMQGTGSRTFPIGDADGYFPFVMNVARDGTALLGLEVIKGDPNISGLIPSEVTDVFTDHYWQMTVQGGSFTGGSAQVSAKGILPFLQNGTTGAPTVLELESDNTLNNLGGLYFAPFIKVATISPKGKIYAIGKTEKVQIVINNVITPTNDDVRNNVLQISDIELFPDNTVTLLDRYGVPVKTWTNFVNFSTSNPQQDSFDFSTLGIGNYICIVKYKTLSGEVVKVSQMVTVLK